MDFQPLQHERSASSNDEGPADEGHFKEVVSCLKHTFFKASSWPSTWLFLE